MRRMKRTKPTAQGVLKCYVCGNIFRCSKKRTLSVCFNPSCLSKHNYLLLKAKDLMSTGHTHKARVAKSIADKRTTICIDTLNRLGQARFIKILNKIIGREILLISWDTPYEEIDAFLYPEGI